MNLTQELEALRHSQHSMEDDFRLHADGSVHEQTITRSGEIGWKVIAKPIPGASPKMSKYFDDGYLSVDDLRRALDLRDMVLTTIVEASTVKSMEEIVRKRITKKEREENKKPRAKRKRIPPIPAEL